MFYHNSVEYAFNFTDEYSLLIKEKSHKIVCMRYKPNKTNKLYYYRKIVIITNVIRNFFIKTKILHGENNLKNKKIT